MADLLKQAVEFHQRGLFDKAETIYRKIVSRFPDHFHALHFLGLLQAQKGNFGDAIHLIGQALTVNPKDASAHFNMGNAFLGLKKYQEALESFDRALALRPDYSQAHNSRGACLLEQGHPERALVSLSTALELNPNYPEALNNHGNALQELNRLEEAIPSYERAIRLRPDSGSVHANLGNALFVLRRYDEALASYDRALGVNPDEPDALLGRGNALMLIDQSERAVADMQRLLQVAPDYDYVKGDLLHAKMQICDWRTFEIDAATIAAGVQTGKRCCSPFAFQAISRSSRDLYLCANTYALDKYPASASPLWAGEKYAHRKIRIGYVSGEFRAQATSYLIAGLFELHARDRFEWFAFDNGFDDATPLRRRLEGSFDHFVDISRQSDLQAAQIIRNNNIDILVNLNGYFGLERTGIFSRRPAPVQVNYLGFPGTLGAAYFDYIIADRCVIYENEHQHYSEKIVYLPDSYQINDAKRVIADYIPARADAGLPANSFVFCCFNNMYKLTPGMFDVWMRILSKVENSVLWLLRTNDAATRNLRSEAVRRGIAPERLVFAPRVKLEDHLARHRLADLFLDALPYNAHTTASDALWSGLPVVTCTGSTFPGRVASSLLTSVGLSDLVTSSLHDYESLALKLATHPELLEDVKGRLARNRLTRPLFNTDRFRQHIEVAYFTMWECCQRGEAPASFSVAAVS